MGLTIIFSRKDLGDIVKLRHVSSVKTPSISMATGPENQAIFRQLMRLIYDTFVNIYQDLLNLSVTIIATLPAASKDNVGKFYLKTNAGAIDTLHIVVYDNSDSSYKFQEVTLS